jgi:hypothetical protein
VASHTNDEKLSASVLVLLSSNSCVRSPKSSDAPGFSISRICSVDTIGITEIELDECVSGVEEVLSHGVATVAAATTTAVDDDDDDDDDTRVAFGVCFIDEALALPSRAELVVALDLLTNAAVLGVLQGEAIVVTPRDRLRKLIVAVGGGGAAAA